MTHFDEATYLARLNYLTGNYPSPIGDFAADLIAQHAAVVRHLATPHRELIAEVEALRSTLKILRGGDAPNQVIRDAKARLTDHTELVAGTPQEPLSEREQELRDAAEGLCDDVDAMAALLAQLLPLADLAEHPQLHTQILATLARNTNAPTH